MGTWRSATPRGRFGVQAGGMIFTSNRHVSPRHRLRGTGFRERDHPVPGTQPRLGHSADPHEEGFSSVPQPPPPPPPAPRSQSQCPPFPPLGQTFLLSLTQPGMKAKGPCLLKSNWPVTSTSPALVLIGSSTVSRENCASLLHQVSAFIWVLQTALQILCHPAQILPMAPHPLWQPPLPLALG